MKRLTFLLLLCLAMGARAQGNGAPWSVDTGGAQDRMAVFADLVVNGTDVALDVLDSHYQIGAFIDGTCRGVGEVVALGGHSWLQIEVFGNYGSVNDDGKTITFRLYEKATAREVELESSTTVTWNGTSYGTPSANHVKLNGVLSYDDDVAFSFPATLVLSKLHETEVLLSLAEEGEAKNIDPSGVKFVFADGPHGWTVARATGGGLEWMLLGLAVGEYDYYVTYKDKRMLADNGAASGKVVIPAEVSLANGWDWISNFMPAPYVIEERGERREESDIWNDVIEVRSQNQTLYNDPQVGLFGDLWELSATAGLYKIKSNSGDNLRVLNLGSSTNGATTASLLPQIEPGYNWICYPHENDHALETLQESLSKSATRGDLIIGRDAFLEFDGYQWVGSLRRFEAGKGYIYYSENESPVRLDWGDYYLPQERENGGTGARGHEGASARACESSESIWNYDAHKYASNMPVVAVLGERSSGARGCEGTGERYSVGAFVGDECRGRGEVVDGEHLFISVSGNIGETVTFRLYDKTTGEYSILDERLHFSMKAGSLRSPVVLRLSGALGCEGTGARGFGGSPTMTVRTLDGRTVLISHDAWTSFDNLPHGVYVVTVANGDASKTIKIAKSEKGGVRR